MTIFLFCLVMSLIPFAVVGWCVLLDCNSGNKIERGFCNRVFFTCVMISFFMICFFMLMRAVRQSEIHEPHGVVSTNSCERASTN